MKRLLSATATEIVFSEDDKHRYLLRKTWDANLPHACVIMLAPSKAADAVAMDMTSMYTINNAYRQGFGAITILNIFCGLEADFVNNQENDKTIVAASKEADKIVLAWGKGCTQKKALARIDEVLKLLEPYKKKLIEISDSKESGYHPLGRTVRLQWELTPYKWQN